MCRKIRIRKILVITVLVIISSFLLREGLLPLRVFIDESNPASSIYHIQSAGHLAEPSNYRPGYGFPILGYILMLFTGLEYLSFEWVSPLLAAIPIIVLVILFTIAQNSIAGDNWWSVPALGASILIFASFVTRLTETTHKSYTFTLVFISLYIAHRTVSGTSDVRMNAVYIVICGAISSFNYIWGAIYGGIIGMVFITNLMLENENSNVQSFLTAIVPVMIPYTISNYLPTSKLHILYFQSVFLSAVSKLSGQSYGSANVRGASTGISVWPTIQIGHANVNMWYIYTFGIFMVAILSMLSSIYCILLLLNSSKSPKFSQTYLPVAVGTGLLAIFLLISGDIATFKRVITIPGIFGVVLYYNLLGTPSSLIPSIRHNREILARITMIILILGAVAATPRTIHDGSVSPYDLYYNESETKSLTWLDNHRETSGYLQVDQHRDMRAATKLGIAGIDHYRTERPSDNRVYDSGGGKLFISN